MNLAQGPMVAYNDINLSFEAYKKGNKLKPLVKWAGGKEQELKYIIPNLPSKFENFYEPFVGGGSVYTAIHAKKYFVNDKSHELIDLYKIIVSPQRNHFFQLLDDLIENWDLLGSFCQANAALLQKTYCQYAHGKIDHPTCAKNLNKLINKELAFFQGLFTNSFCDSSENFILEIKKNLSRKTGRMRTLELKKGKLPEHDILKNIETAIRSAFYMHCRYLYNQNAQSSNPDTKVLQSALFLFVRNFAYSGMFRYNANGDFNVPYGGIAYNRKNFKKKVDYLRSKPLAMLLKASLISNADFADFFRKNPPSKKDFVFLDPPYDTEFSTYAQNDFDQKDQTRLAQYLIHDCAAKWMMIIKKTDFISGLYDHPTVSVRTFDKTYLVSFMNRNKKETEHLLITNY